jgi:hypothetical protein
VYCHLDYHELFSPRCKHCDTPIENEVISALGNKYHPGHFFCAGCGDVISRCLRRANDSHLVQLHRLLFETSILGARDVMRINMRPSVLNVASQC